MFHTIKVWQWCMRILGGLAILYWLMLNMMYGSISFSIMFCLVGVLLILISFLLPLLQRHVWNAFPRMLKRLCLVFLLLLISLCSFIELRILYDGHTSSSRQGDYILVLGAGLIHGDQISTTLKYRLDKALEVHQENPDTMIIVSGGQGIDERISEAKAMKQYLEAHGVDPSLILMEDKSTNTSENFEFSKALIEQQEFPSMRISLITNGFHIHRASYLAQIAGFESYNQPSDGLWATELCFYTREFFGVIRAYLLGY